MKIKLPLRELSEKIVEGDCSKEAVAIINEKKHLSIYFDKIPSLKDLQIPQELFYTLQLTVKECLNQILTISMGVVKKAKVIKFNEKELFMIVTDGEYPGKLCYVVLDNPQEKYGLIGNILKRKI